MEQYKQEFIEFMIESNVLKFGDFTLKSGRKSPFFMNAGAYGAPHIAYYKPAMSILMNTETEGRTANITTFVFPQPPS